MHPSKQTLGVLICLAALTSCSNEPVGVRSRLGTLAIQEGEFHCVHPSHPNPAGYPDCKDVPVIVLIKPSGGCLALVPYFKLVVHTNGKKKTEVEWNLATAPKGYKFDTTGIPLELDPSTGDPTLPTVIWEDKGPQGADRKKYRWEVRQDAAYDKQFKHVAKVLPPTGTVPCEEADPLIVNVD